MKFGLTYPARPSPYDRAPGSIGSNYIAAGVAPHALVARSTVTIAANRKALLSSVTASAYRATAPGTSGKIEVIHAVNDNRPGTTYAAYIAFSLAAAGNNNGYIEGIQKVLLPAEQLVLYTGDASIGGTLDYTLTSQLDAFDA